MSVDLDTLLDALTLIDTVEFLRDQIAFGDEPKQRISEYWNRFYQLMVETCLQLALVEPSYYFKAFEYVERSKARNLVSLLSTRDIMPKGNISEIAIQELQRLRQEIAIEQRLPNNGISSNVSRLNQLRAELDYLITQQIKPVDPAFSATQQVTPLTFDDVQAAIDEHTVIVEWFIMDELWSTSNNGSIKNGRIRIFIITCEEPFITVRETEFEDFAAFLEWNNTYFNQYVFERSYWRKQMLDNLKRLAELLNLADILSFIPEKYDRLILVPNRTLHLLPLHALPLPDGNFLIDRFPRGVSYAPSCQILLLSRKQKDFTFSNLFAIENPEQNLPYATIEVQAFSKLFHNSHVLSEEVANKDTLKISPYTEWLQTANCIHFACHGTFRFDAPLESCLSLAEGTFTLSTGQKLQNIEELSHLVIQIQHDIADVVESIAK
jgi:CHAT domain-containing protein